MMMRNTRVLTVAAATAIVLAAARAASAQEAADTEAMAIEEIVVTAQKREESVQDVPVSIAAFTGTTLQNAQVDSVATLPRLVPNFSANRGPQTANMRIAIRGIGAAGNSAIDPSVGSFMDGIYVPRPGTLFASFNDLAAVEVLRGPQGTLFGRNATVGAINMRSMSPQDELDGTVSLEAGSYGMQKYTAMLNMPVGDRFAFRAAGLYESTDGYTENTVTGKEPGYMETTAVRVGGTWKITDDVKWTLKYNYANISGDGYSDSPIIPDTVTPANQARLNLIFGGNPPEIADPFNRKTNQVTDGDLSDEQWGLASDLSWEIGDWTVRWLAGYQDWQNEQYEADVLFTTRYLLGRTGGYDSTSESTELQLISPVDQLIGGRLDFVAGLYYFEEDFSILEQLSMLSDFCNTLIAPPAFTAAQRAACNASPNKANATVLNFKQNATNYAAYAQANFKLIDNLTLVAGGRYTKDDKSGTFDQQVFNAFAAAIPLRAREFAKLEKNDDQPTYRLGLNWTPTDELLFYGSYSTGYKSGGFNSGGGQVNLTKPPPAGPGPDGRIFDKETSDDYELGAKTTWAGGLAHFNVNLFRMDLHDFQDRAFNGASFNVINAGNLRQQGVEAEADTVVLEGLRIFGALGYLDSEFTEYDNASCLPTPAQLNPQCTQNLKGVANIYSPKWTVSAGTEMRGDFDFADIGYLFRADMNYVDEQNANAIIDNNPQGFEPSYALLSARYVLQFGTDRRYSVAVFGENLTDQGYCRGRFYQPFNTNLGLNQPLAVGGGTVTRCNVNAPRTFGVQFKASFF